MWCAQDMLTYVDIVMHTVIATTLVTCHTSTITDTHTHTEGLGSCFGSQSIRKGGLARPTLDTLGWVAAGRRGYS